MAMLSATSLVPEAHAQQASPILAAASGGFFNDLMGLLGSKPNAPRQIERPVQVPGYGTTRRRDQKSLGAPRGAGSAGSFGGGIESSQEERPRRGGGYRTMCVRLCDGYYWPISNSASSSDLNADKRTCESSCMTPAKLYYQTDRGEDPARMRGLDGKVYQKLETAFAYRKSLQPACRCRPDPWSASEEMRHQSYGNMPPVAAADTTPPVVASTITMEMLLDSSAEASTLTPDDTLPMP